ncbi:MAG TPA: cytochrome c [Novosphingobium sp.]
MNPNILLPRVSFALLAAAIGLPLASPAVLNAQDNPGNKAAVEPASEGKDLYEQICQACHMPDAKGGAGAGTGVPALAGNPHLADKTFAINRVWNGYGGMPRFGAMLSPPQVAAVLTYVRGHFNAYPEAVTPADVDAVAAGQIPKADCNCGH